MTGIQPSEDRLLMDLIKTNQSTEGDTLTKKQYRKHGEYNPWQAANRFNTWNNARASAGIYKNKKRNQRVKDTDILEDMKQVNNDTEGLLTVQKYRDHGEYSISAIYNRFNSFPSARSKAYNI